MSARELHDEWAEMDKVGPLLIDEERAAIAIRALSLLSSVEDGEGVVQDLGTLAADLLLEGLPDEAEIPQRAAARIAQDAQEKAALKGQADVLDALNTSQAHEIALLKTKLASVKAHAEEMEGLLLLALYHHQGGSSPVGQPIRKALGIGQHDHMTDEQIERGKDAGRAAHPKEGA